MDMQRLARRAMVMSSATLALGSASLARAATGGDADASNPGPDNATLLGQFPSSDNPPHTDRGDVPNLWFPFSQAHRRIQPGGWSRQVTVQDFPVAKSIAGVNMRLTAGGVRELHWHLPAEWAFMVTGRARARRRSAAVRLLARRQAAGLPDRQRQRAHRRFAQLPDRLDHRRRAGRGESRRDARTALAPERG
jgi:hypothetical protein